MDGISSLSPIFWHVRVSRKVSCTSVRPSSVVPSSRLWQTPTRCGRHPCGRVSYPVGTCSFGHNSLPLSSLDTGPDLPHIGDRCISSFSSTSDPRRTYFCSSRHHSYTTVDTNPTPPETPILHPRPILRYPRPNPMPPKTQILLHPRHQSNLMPPDTNPTSPEPPIPLQPRHQSYTNPTAPETNPTSTETNPTSPKAPILRHPRHQSCTTRDTNPTPPETPILHLPRHTNDHILRSRTLRHHQRPPGGQHTHCSGLGRWKKGPWGLTSTTHLRNEWYNRSGLDPLNERRIFYSSFKTGKKEYEHTSLLRKPVTTLVSTPRSEDV